MSERNKIQDLVEFVQKAVKLAKYNSNTGGGILIAIRVAEKGLLPEEPRDIDYLLSHMQELFIRQKDLALSAQSQAVYFGRIKKAVEDYKKYGFDARAIYSWSPKLRARKSSSKKTVSENKSENEIMNEPTISGSISVNTNDHVVKEVGGVKLNVVTWRLRPGVLVKIELPEDLKKADVERIKRLLDLEVELIE
ncbi:MAG: hypothetical protein JNN00_19250 [Chitinophagaceae bacterium]|nr:hypothetical protein [Chitinophagaceae bacterium]